MNSALSKDEQIKKEARINVTAYQGKVLLTGRCAEHRSLFPGKTDCRGR